MNSDDRPERDLQQLANDTLDSSADKAREAAQAKLKAYMKSLNTRKRSLIEVHHPELLSTTTTN